MRYFSYRNKMRLRSALIVLLIVLAVLTAISIGIFCYLQRYIVYTPTGAHLDFSTRPGSGASQSNPVNPNFVVETPPLQQDTDLIITDSQEVSSAPEQTDRISGVYITGAMLADIASVQDALDLLSEPTAVMMDVKSIFGNYYYNTSLAGAETSSLVDAAEVDRLIRSLAAQEQIYLIAKLPAFRDSAFALANQECGLPLSSGALWMDVESCYWLDPANDKVVSHLESIALELQSFGFDEVVYDDFHFPDSPNIVYNDDKNEAVQNTAKRLAANLAGSDIQFSLCTQDPSLADYAARIYVKDAEGADVQTLASALDSKYSPLENHLVFLTDSRDTRFSKYGLLKSAVPAAGEN